MRASPVPVVAQEQRAGVERQFRYLLLLYSAAASLLGRGKFRLAFPAPRRALGRTVIHPGVIGFVAQHPVHGLLQVHRGRDRESLVGLEKDEFAGGPFETEEQRAFPRKTGHHIVEPIKLLRR